MRICELSLEFASFQRSKLFSLPTQLKNFKTIRACTEITDLHLFICYKKYRSAFNNQTASCMGGGVGDFPRPYPESNDL
jgi:hypothetical protein